MATMMINLTKYEFYNMFTQFLYPTLVVDGSKNNDEEKKENEMNSVIRLYNSSIFNITDNINDNNKIKKLVIDLRDQGAEYFNRLLIITQNNKYKQQLLKQLCDKISNESKSLQTFFIFINKDNNLFSNQLQILTTDWYNKYKSNNKECIGYPSIPSMIENNLFISARICSEDLFILQSLNIKIIINCTKSLKNHFENNNKNSNIKYHRIPINDKDDEKIQRYLVECYKLLNDYIDNKNLNVLVHCNEGKSRSVAMVTYYFMKKYNLTCVQSLQRIRNLRPIASPNKGFMNQLKQLEE